MHKIIYNKLKNIHNIYLLLPKKHRISIVFCSGFILLLFFISLINSTSEQTNETSYQVGVRYFVPFEDDLEAVEQVAIENINDADIGINPINTNKLTTTPTLVAQENKVNSTEPSHITAFQLLKNDSNMVWKTTKVKSGDSLAKIFNKLGLSPQTTYNVTHAQGDSTAALKNLNVGDKLLTGFDQQNQLIALEYSISLTQTLYIQHNEQNFEAFVETKTVETRENFAHGTIKTNFWDAGVAAGLEDKQIIALANVFGWDIDFSLDLRTGDSFHVIYETEYIEGEYIGTGKILAAEFINQNETYQAIRFTDDEFYTPEGKSMRKAFLRAPVNFKYIVSNFKPKRFHPIQKRWKAHNGTDYSANTGTPVVASGNGRVIQSAYNQYNGHYVFIQHGNGIVTKYLHFSKRLVKKGDKVKQGQIIGKVGATGLAEGPHLHYEFLLNGVHRNPRTIKLPDANPIDKSYQKDFNALAKQRLQELSGSKQALYSMLEVPNNASSNAKNQQTNP